MAESVCPWWIGYFLASPLRGLRHNPETILSGHVREGMNVLEPGPGMGFFTLPMARMVGPSGRVVAVDLQERMIQGLLRRAARVGLSDRIEGRVASSSGMGVGDLVGRLDFALLFAMVHEVPDQVSFFAEVSAALRSGARVLFAEPLGHVPEADFRRSLGLAASADLRFDRRLNIGGCVAALLTQCR